MLWCAGSSQTVTWARASRVLINIGLSAPYFINSSNNSWFQTDRQVDRGQGSGDQHMLTTTDQRWVQINTILHIRSEAITTAKQRKIGKTFLFSTHSYSPTYTTRVAGAGLIAFLIYLPSANLQSDIWIVGNPLGAFYVNGPVVF